MRPEVGHVYEGRWNDNEEMCGRGKITFPDGTTLISLFTGNSIPNVVRFNIDKYTLYLGQIEDRR